MRKLCSAGTGSIISHFEFFGVKLYSRTDIALIHFGESGGGGGGGMVKHALSLWTSKQPLAVYFLAVTHSVYPMAILEILSQIRGSLY